jgi:hypothetical protein
MNPKRTNCLLLDELEAHRKCATQIEQRLAKIARIKEICERAALRSPEAIEAARASVDSDGPITSTEVATIVTDVIATAETGLRISKARARIARIQARQIVLELRRRSRCAARRRELLSSRCRAPRANRVRRASKTALKRDDGSGSGGDSDPPPSFRSGGQEAARRRHA